MALKIVVPIGCALLLAPLQSLHAQAEHVAGARRAWTPADSIEARYFALNFEDPQHWPTSLDNPEGILFSPDRRYFLYVQYRGDLKEDAAVATVTIFESRAVSRALRSRLPDVAPFRTFEVRGYSSQIPALRHLRWDEESQGLLFDGADEGGQRTAFFFDLDSATTMPLARISPASPDDPEPIFAYRNRASLLFSAALRSRPPDRYPGGWIERVESKAAAFNQRPIFTDYIWKVAYGRPAHLVRAEAKCGGRDAPRPDVETPVAAAAISPAHCEALLVAPKATGGYEYRYLDMATGKSRSLGAARSGRPSMSWSPDGQWALLSNSDDKTGPVAMLSAASGALLPIVGAGPGAERSSLKPAWISPTSVLISDPNSPSGISRLDYTSGHWMRRAAVKPAPTPEKKGEFYVAVEQALNDPGRVIARTGDAAIILSQPDPVLGGVYRHQWQEVSFVTPTGQSAHAALMLPSRQTGDRTGPPPLVVNPYWFENAGGSHNRLFLPDGLHDGAESAAQALAARGIAVLWMDGWKDVPTIGTPAEGAEFVKTLDAVLSHLIDKGLVDPQRIGVAGYSRGGYISLYSATHPGRVPIRTHIVIDSYLGYAANAFYFKTVAGDDPSLNLFLDRPGVLERDNMMNVDRIRGPVLFTLNPGRAKLEDERDSVQRVGLRNMQGAFLAARRPFDSLTFPDGAHNLLRPRERLMLMNAIVDWMSYWLMDETPEDADRARIWSRLRADWDRQKAWEAAGNPAASEPPQNFRSDIPARPAP